MLFLNVWVSNAIIRMLYKSGEKKSLQIKDVGYEYANSLGWDGLRVATWRALKMKSSSFSLFLILPIKGREYVHTLFSPFRKHTPNKTLRFVFTLLTYSMGRSCGLFSRRKAGKSIAGKNGTHPETFHYLSSRRADIQWTDCGWEIVNTYQWETVVVLGIPGADHLSPSSLLNCVFISIHCLPYWFPLWYVLEYLVHVSLKV